MRHAWIALLAMVVSAVALSAPAATPGLVEVSSEYKDQASGKTVRFEGYGVVVEVPEGTSAKPGFYVITDHHLSGGRGTRVTLGGVAQEVSSRLSDIDLDTEVLELASAPADAFARLDPSTGDLFVAPKSLKAMGAGFVPLDYMEALYVPKSFKSRFSTDLADGRAGLLAPHYLQTHALDRYDERILWSQGGFDRKSPYRILPGMSGLPLIREEGSRWILSGLAQSFLRYMSGSFFSTPATFRELLAGIGHKPAPSGDYPRWSVRSGVLYREYAKGTREIPWLGAPSGNGLGSDGGNGLGSDGGNSSATDSAKIPQGFEYEGAKILAFRVRLKSCARLDDRGWRSIYGPIAQSRPQYHMNDGEFEPVSFERDQYLWANVGAFRFIRKNPDCVRLAGVVRDGDDLMPILESRVLLELAYGKKAPLESYLLYNTFGDGLRVNKNGFSLDVSSDDKRDRVSARFERTGALKGRRGFEPIVTLRSRRLGRAVVLDLRTLFFQDVEESINYLSESYYAMMGKGSAKSGPFKRMIEILESYLGTKGAFDFGSPLFDPREMERFAPRIKGAADRRFFKGWFNESWLWFGLAETQHMPTVSARDASQSAGGFSERVVPLSIFK